MKKSIFINSVRRNSPAVLKENSKCSLFCVLSQEITRAGRLGPVWFELSFVLSVVFVVLLFCILYKRVVDQHFSSLLTCFNFVKSQVKGAMLKIVQLPFTTRMKKRAIM